MSIQFNADIYWASLESVLLIRGGCRHVPELYRVPLDDVAAEKLERHSQKRIPAGITPYLWAQSMYIICSLVYEGFLLPAELDPLSRRLAVYEKRPPCEVQVVILAENRAVQSILRDKNLRIQTVDDIDPVFSIQPASVFVRILARVGLSDKMNLTGRPTDRDVGLLSTSKLYQLGNKFIIFTPQFMDRKRSHLMHDIRILMDEWRSELQYIYNCWNSASISGRPLVVLIIDKNMLKQESATLGSVLSTASSSVVIATIKKISSGYLGGARVVMKNLNDFFRTTAVSKLEIHDSCIEESLLNQDREPEYRALPTVDSDVDLEFHRRLNSFTDRRARQFSAIHKTSMHHRGIFADGNDIDLARLRLIYANQAEESPSFQPKFIIDSEDDDEEPPEILHTNPSFCNTADLTFVSSSKVDLSSLKGLSDEDVFGMLSETDVLEEQASIVHFLWMKRGPDFNTHLNEIKDISVRLLMEELYSKACIRHDWALVRLCSGVLGKRLEELSKAVTHLLVRQKQLTVGDPTINEQPITCPKTNEELEQIMKRAYSINQSSLFTLAQELIVCLGSMVRTEPKLFTEMFRLRVGLIIQVLTSELARIRQLSIDEASQQLLTLSPFELKRMLFELLSGRLLEELVFDGTDNKEHRTGMGSIRRQIQTLRESTRDSPLADPEQDETTELTSESTDFVFGVWLRHRRIDGALNRVPAGFYAIVWDTLRRFPRGLRINNVFLNWGLTQEMTRREIKFALQVEGVLNKIPQPEYRELMVESLSLLSKLNVLLKTDKVPLPLDRPFDVDSIPMEANRIFVQHNKDLDTIVTECCAAPVEKRCVGAQGICRHFYDSAPAGEFGTAHYLIRALMTIFHVDDNEQ